eukprot:scaffold6578_cov141-Skeletonema_marinoi.AAC.7
MAGTPGSSIGIYKIGNYEGAVNERELMHKDMSSSGKCKRWATEEKEWKRRVHDCLCLRDKKESVGKRNALLVFFLLIQ